MKPAIKNATVLNVFGFNATLSLKRSAMHKVKLKRADIIPKANPNFGKFIKFLPTLTKLRVAIATKNVLSATPRAKFLKNVSIRFSRHLRFYCEQQGLSVASVSSVEMMVASSCFDEVLRSIGPFYSESVLGLDWELLSGLSAKARYFSSDRGRLKRPAYELSTE